VQDTENQHDVSDTDSRNGQNLLKGDDLLPAGEADGNVSKVDQVVTSQQNPVDCQAELRIMDEIFQINGPCPVASSPHIDRNVKADGKKKQIG
jgi:hypothetical protein